MKILLLDASAELNLALRRLGHDVTNLQFNGGIIRLQELLERQKLAPDLVVQQERLGTRNYYLEIETLSCPTLFWSIDTHLNMFWHQWYILLFDGVLTPHTSLFDKLPQELQPKAIQRFPMWGQDREWTPHNERQHFLSFCGRVDQHRPLRKWLMELLRNHGLHFEDNLTPQQMMTLYDTSRIIPNESIAREVNFRLMEGASSGCLVLSPDLGNDQNTLLEPETEFFPHTDGTELLEQIAWAKKNPSTVESMGLAARTRIQKEHLPIHRAQTLVDFGASLTRHRASGCIANLALWNTFSKQVRNGTLSLTIDSHVQEGLDLLAKQPSLAECSPLEHALVAQTLTQCLCLYAEQSSVQKALALADKLLEETPLEDDPQGAKTTALPAYPMYCLKIASTASAIALREKNFEKALVFWQRYAGKNAPQPQTDVALYELWADALAKQSVIMEVGFLFNADTGYIPESAYPFLQTASNIAPDMALAHACKDLLSQYPTFIQVYLGLLAQCCLLDQKNWQPQMEFGIASIKSYRVTEGLEELLLAKHLADQAGQTVFFDRILKVHCPKGHIQRAMQTGI